MLNGREKQATGHTINLSMWPAAIRQLHCCKSQQESSDKMLLESDPFACLTLSEDVQVVKHTHLGIWRIEKHDGLCCTSSNPIEVDNGAGNP